MLLSYDRSVPPLCMHNVTVLPLYYNIINSSTQARFQSETAAAQRSPPPSMMSTWPCQGSAPGWLIWTIMEGHVLACLLIMWY